MIIVACAAAPLRRRRSGSGSGDRHIRSRIVRRFDLQRYVVILSSASPPRVARIFIPLAAASPPRRRDHALRYRTRHHPLRGPPPYAVPPPPMRRREQRTDLPFLRVPDPLVEHLVDLVVRQAVVHAHEGRGEDDGGPVDGAVGMELHAKREGAFVGHRFEGHRSGAHAAMNGRGMGGEREK